LFWGLTSQGASFIFDLYLAISGAKTPQGTIPRSNGTQKKIGPSGPISAAVRLRSFQVFTHKLDFIFVLLNNRPNHGGLVKTCSWPPEKHRRPFPSVKRACSRLVRIMPPIKQSRRYAPAASLQSSYFTLSGCQLLSQGGPGVRLARHRRRWQALRRHRCTARRIGGFDKHCDDASQPGHFSHGQRGRDVRYARTTINANHVSKAFLPLYCPGFMFRGPICLS
jgi:hypothetical protein